MVLVVFIEVVISFTVLAAIGFGCGIWRANVVAYKMTYSIIFLYDTLYERLESRKGKKGAAIILSYKESSKELNEL